MTMSELVGAWQGFYGAVANVGATLVGLVYVGVSIHLGRRPLDRRVRLLGTMSGVNLLYPVLAALIMLMPVSHLVQGAALAGLAALCIGATVSIAIVESHHPEGQVRLMIAYRYFVPLFAAVVLGVGSISLVLEHQWSTYAVPAFVVLMFVIGADNAWDLLLERYTKRSVIDLDTPPVAVGPDAQPQDRDS